MLEDNKVSDPQMALPTNLIDRSQQQQGTSTVQTYRNINIERAFDKNMEGHKEKKTSY